MVFDKTRTNLSIPTPLYELLNKDSQKYGIAKSVIVSNLLLNYYRNKIDFDESVVNDISLDV